MFNIEIFNDDRANRFFDIFPILDGQVTVSIIHPNQFSGWHMHKNQTDYFCVVSGSLWIYTITPQGKLDKILLSGSSPRTIVISPQIIHSWKSSSSGATLIYYLSKKHDESDEFRFTLDDIYKTYNIDFSDEL